MKKNSPRGLKMINKATKSETTDGRCDNHENINLNYITPDCFDCAIFAVNRKLKFIFQNYKKYVYKKS